MAEWTIAEPTVLDLDEVVSALDVRLVAGHVDVVTTEGDGARVEVSEVDGTPVHVRISGGRLSIGHDDLRWEGILGWLRSRHDRRRAVVSVAVPARVEASVGVVSADAVVAGIDGGVTVRCVSGDVVLDGTTGDVRVDSVSGDVEARGLAGDVALKSVSGGLTVVDGTPTRVHARSVSGDVVLDLRASTTASIDVTTVSGDLTVRMPGDAGIDVDVLSATGDVASAFDGLSVQARPGSNKMTGRVGAGNGTLHGRTVSGRVALLARESV